MMLTRHVFVFLRRRKCVALRSSRNSFNSTGRMYFEMVLLTIGFVCFHGRSFVIYLNVFISAVGSTVDRLNPLLILCYFCCCFNRSISTQL